MQLYFLIVLFLTNGTQHQFEHEAQITPKDKIHFFLEIYKFIYHIYFLLIVQGFSTELVI